MRDRTPTTATPQDSLRQILGRLAREAKSEKVRSWAQGLLDGDQAEHKRPARLDREGRAAR